MMNLFLISLLNCLLMVGSVNSLIIKGKVSDEKGEPLEFINVFVEGTMYGAISDMDGGFEFTASLEQGKEYVLKASFIGMETWFKIIAVENSDDVTDGAQMYFEIVMKPEVKYLKGAKVVAGSYMLKGISSMDHQNSVDLVSTGGSEGDIIRSLSTLPGAQVAGLDGKLIIRGGDSRESQTYIDGMHVLSQYNAGGYIEGARARYSPFIFSGINFSTGGYSPEYSQSLSSVLPMTTRNESPYSKVGMSLMNVSAGANANKAWEKSSLSVNYNYTDMTLYNKLFNSQRVQSNWTNPYSEHSGEAQFRTKVGEESYLKTFIAANHIGFENSGIGYQEDNYYLNSIFNGKVGSKSKSESKSDGLRLFVGGAYSYNDKQINQSYNDTYQDIAVRERELHIKSKIGKRVSNLYNFDAGVEMFSNFYELGLSGGYTPLYLDTLSYKIAGLFLSNDFYLSEGLTLNLSARGEYFSVDKGSFVFLPRAALSYSVGKFSFSAVLGRYQQMTYPEYMLWNRDLMTEKCMQYMLGIYWNEDGRIFRAEFYDKEYNDLPIYQEYNLGEYGWYKEYTSGGYGYSRGIDLYLYDQKSIENIEYSVSYSLNDSKRLYLDNTKPVRPHFSARHNGTVSVKYFNWNIKTYLGLAYRYSSGKPYTDPNIEGKMNSTTPWFHSLDLSLTVLAHPKLIVYAGITNILNTKNVYGYSFNPEPVPIMAEVNRNFYIGLFLTLGKNVAYNASNF